MDLKDAWVWGRAKCRISKEKPRFVNCIAARVTMQLVPKAG